MRLRVLIFFVAISAFLLGAVGGIWAQAFFMPYLAFQDPFQEWKFVQNWSERTTVIREVKAVVIQLDDAIERVAARAESMVVGIESRGSGRGITGDGFSVFEDGFILTLASIVPQGYEVMVFMNDEEGGVEAQVLKRDVKKDVALLQIEKSGLKTTSFADEEDIKLGMSVLLLGKVFEEDKLITIVNKGVIKALSEDKVRTTIFEKTVLKGSPLFNIEGKILGLNVIDKEGKVTAIPASTLRSFSGL